MKRRIPFAWAYQITSLLSFVIVGGLVVAYGIHVRPKILQTEFLAVGNSESLPDGPLVKRLFAPVIPGSFDGKIRIGPGFNAIAEWKDADQKAAFTTEQFLKLVKVQNGDGESFARNTKDADSNCRKVYSSNSAILPPNPSICEKTLLISGERDKAYIEPRIREGKYIDINLSAQSLSLFENGKLLDSYLVSTGKIGMETPGGTHAITNKARRAWSKKYGVFMPFWMAITPSGMFGIHELPECQDGFKEGAEHLGMPVSHGCVRLGVGPAKRVYNWAEIGTLVVVH